MWRPDLRGSSYPWLHVRNLRQASLVIGCFAASSAAAQPQVYVVLPPLDLGQTSFLDGEAKPGALLEIIGDGATASYFTEGNGRSPDGTHKQWLSTVVAHPVYLSKVPVFGSGLLGLEFLVPVAFVHQDLPGMSATTQGGVGDLTIAPLSQWSDGHLFGSPLSVRAALQVVAPTGTYSPQRQIGAGQNAWQVSPYLAFTWRATERWELSGRVIYDWSSRNSRPPAALNGENDDDRVRAPFAGADHPRVAGGGMGPAVLNFSGKGSINNVRDLDAYAVEHRLDGFVVNGKAYLRKSSERYQAYLRGTAVQGASTPAHLGLERG